MDAPADDPWYSPYHLKHIDGKWQISRARLDGAWRYTLWSLNREGTHRMVGHYTTVDEAKENAK